MQNDITSPGITSNERYPTDEVELYATPAELSSMLGFSATEAQIRFAMSLIHGHCNRRTFWPAEYQERLTLPGDRLEARVSYTPVLQILTAKGRYAYGRRDRRTMNQVNYDYIAALAVFGSPPRYVEIDVNQISLYGPTGEVWFPTGLFLVGYNEVEITYLAGFQDIPSRLKTAVCNIVNSVCTKGVADRTSYSIGRVSRTFSRPSFIDEDTEMLLEPFVVKTYA